MLNTFRYSLVKKPMDIVFKIYDTRGTAEGAVTAAKKGARMVLKYLLVQYFHMKQELLRKTFLVKT